MYMCIYAYIYTYIYIYIYIYVYVYVHMYMYTLLHVIRKESAALRELAAGESLELVEVY